MMAMWTPLSPWPISSPAVGGATIAAELEGPGRRSVVAAPEVVGREVVDQGRDRRLEHGLAEREHGRARRHEQGGAERAGDQAGRAEEQPGAGPHHAHHGDHPGPAHTLDATQHEQLQHHDHQRVGGERETDGPRGDLADGAREGRERRR